MIQLLKGKASRTLTKAYWVYDDMKRTGSEILLANVKYHTVNMNGERSVDGVMIRRG